MNEPPILFSGPMVRAILEGRKTQTRRVIKPQPIPMGVSSYGGTRQGWNWKRETLNRSWNDDDKDPYRKACLANKALSGHCPYGQPGDRLWLRETWADVRGMGLDEDLFPNGVAYRADCTHQDSLRCAADYGVKWKPSIHMPRWASRITLEIESVRVERVQEISEEDAKSEGTPDDALVHYYCEEGNDDDPIGNHRCNWRYGFSRLWDSINLKRGFGWEANPLVWVITFRRVK